MNAKESQGIKYIFKFNIADISYQGISLYSLNGPNRVFNSKLEDHKFFIKQEENMDKLMNHRIHQFLKLGSSNNDK